MPLRTARLSKKGCGFATPECRAQRDVAVHPRPAPPPPLPAAPRLPTTALGYLEIRWVVRGAHLRHRRGAPSGAAGLSGGLQHNLAHRTARVPDTRSRAAEPAFTRGTSRVGSGVSQTAGGTHSRLQKRLDTLL